MLSFACELVPGALETFSGVPGTLTDASALRLAGDFAVAASVESIS